jgi:hypothetical protein
MSGYSKPSSEEPLELFAAELAVIVVDWFAAVAMLLADGPEVRDERAQAHRLVGRVRLVDAAP